MARGSGQTMMRATPRQTRELAIAAFLFLLAFAVFGLSRNLDVGDSAFSMLLSESILHRRSVFLDGYKFPGEIPHLERAVPPIGPQGSALFQLGIVNGHVICLFPHGTSFLSLPFVAVANLLGVHTANAQGRYNGRGEFIIQKALATFLMALLTVITYWTARVLLPAGESAIIAIVCAFGTQVWSSASRGMWSSTWLILLAQIAILELLRSEVSERPPRAATLATILSWMYFCRPTASIPIAVLSVYVFWFHRRSFIVYAATGAAWAIAFFMYSLLAFGTWIPGYYAGSRLTFHDLPVHLAGLLVSPSRGLFVFVPVTGFVLYRVARYWRWLPERRLAGAAILVVALLTLATAGYSEWWGGWAYGPRVLTDTVPWFALLAILGLAAAPPLPVRKLGRVEACIGLALAACSIAINARGAFPQTNRWNVVADIDHHPERAFDWSYPQFLAGLISPPQGWRSSGS